MSERADGWGVGGTKERWINGLFGMKTPSFNQ